MLLELPEPGIIPPPPLPDDHFPADHDEFMHAVNRDRAVRPRRRRGGMPPTPHADQPANEVE